MPEKIQLTLRLEPGMHEQIKREADNQDRSAASLVTHYIRRGLSQGQLGGLGFDQPRGLDFYLDQPYGLSRVLGEILRRIDPSSQVPLDTTLDQLLQMAREASERRFGSQQ
jgi:hypothetical protein